MNVSAFSIITRHGRGLNSVFFKNKRLGYSLFRNLASICSSVLENQVYVPVDTQYSTSDNLKWVSIKSAENNGFCLTGKEIVSFSCSQSSLYGEMMVRESDGVKKIKSILVKCGWNLKRIEIDEFNVVRILNDLYDFSSNAVLAFFFFRLCASVTETEHEVRSICTMIHILVSGNMNHKAMDLVQLLVCNQDVREDRHYCLFDVLEETGRDRRALESVYSMLVSSYVRENMIGMALKLVDRMKMINIFPAIGVCNSLIRKLLKSKMMELAWDLFGEMLIRGMGNTCIISLFIHEYCNDGSLGSAYKLLVEMPKFGFEPDVVAYTTVIDAFCKMGFLKEGTSILFKMVQKGMQVDPVLFTCILDSYCKMKGLSDALNLFKVFRFSPNIFVYNSLISKLCIDGVMVEAVELVHEMSQLGMHPDCYIYTNIISGFCKIGDLGKALAFFGQMLKKGLKPATVTYSILIDGYCKIGNLEMAEYLFGMIKKEGLEHDVVACNKLMDGYAKKGNMHKAYELLDMMTLARISPDAATYNIIIHGLVKRGFVKESREILDELIRRGFSPDVFSFTSIISGFSKEGSFEEAFLVWYHMSEHGAIPDTVTCSALLNGYCKVHRMEEANALFHKMLDAGLEPDLVLYNTLIHGFCSEGNIHEACKLVSVMAEHGVIPNDVTYGSLVNAFEKNYISHPAENAFIRMQQILLKYGIHADVSQYTSASRPSSSLCPTLTLHS